ncbi:MAG: iron export ABC transporter permease subunit FetB [Thermodesulfobacteriota bacterium]
MTSGGVIALGSIDLGLAAVLFFLLAIFSWKMSLGLEKRIVISGLRMTVQLLLIGLVLKFLFTRVDLLWVSVMALIMLLAAGREVRARQKRRISGGRGYLIGTGSMFISSFSITIIALVTMVQVDPWYSPRYAIPLLGMLLGNTMNGIALASDRLTSQIYDQRAMIEQRLMLGENWQEASNDLRRDCMRTGMIPIINAMAAAGLVSLPGMMTGQILGGSSPIDAVKYQILIMFLIGAGSGFGVICSIRFTCDRLFDDRHRLRLEYLDG